MADAQTQPQFVGQMVPIDLLVPSPMNPRKKFTDASLVDLTANIKQLGEVIVPLVLRSKGKKFEIIDGERRYRASTAAGNITHLPAIVRDDMTDSAAIEMMLLTSIQKQELTPLEEASGFKALIESNKSKYSAAYIADNLGELQRRRLRHVLDVKLGSARGADVLNAMRASSIEI